MSQLMQDAAASAAGQEGADMDIWQQLRDHREAVKVRPILSLLDDLRAAAA